MYKTFNIKRSPVLRLAILLNIDMLEQHNAVYDISFPNNKVHGANMESTWALSASDRPHISPMNLAISVVVYMEMVSHGIISTGEPPAAQAPHVRRDFEGISLVLVKTRGYQCYGQVSEIAWNINMVTRLSKLNI